MQQRIKHKMTLLPAITNCTDDVLAKHFEELKEREHKSYYHGDIAKYQKAFKAARSTRTKRIAAQLYGASYDAYHRAIASFGVTFAHWKDDKFAKAVKEFLSSAEIKETISLYPAWAIRRDCVPETGCATDSFVVSSDDAETDADSSAANKSSHLEKSSSLLTKMEDDLFNLLSQLNPKLADPDSAEQPDVEHAIEIIEKLGEKFKKMHKMLNEQNQEKKQDEPAQKKRKLTPHATQSLFSTQPASQLPIFFPLPQMQPPQLPYPYSSQLPQPPSTPFSVIAAQHLQDTSSNQNGYFRNNFFQNPTLSNVGASNPNMLQNLPSSSTTTTTTVQQPQSIRPQFQFPPGYRGQ